MICTLILLVGISRDSHSSLPVPTSPLITNNSAVSTVSLLPQVYAQLPLVDIDLLLNQHCYVKVLCSDNKKNADFEKIHILKRIDGNVINTNKLLEFCCLCLGNELQNVINIK